MTEEELRALSSILKGRSIQGPYSMPSGTFESVYQEYPRLRSGDFRLVVDPELMGGQGNIEFYPTGTSPNPKGLAMSLPPVSQTNPTIALRSLESNPNLQRRLLGDMLHNLPETDEKFSEMKQSFIRSMTPEQIALDKKVYKEATMPKGSSKHAYGEERSYEDWFDRSRSDAHIRGYIAADENDEWKDAYTDEQKIILDNIIRYLKEEEDK
jgi:hypothetical protein